MRLPRHLLLSTLAIDLLNTAWQPDGQTFDWLDDEAAVRSFASEYGLDLAAGDVDKARSTLVDARQLVERLFQGATEGPIDDELVAAVNAALSNATSTYTESADGPHISISSSDPTQSLAIEAVVNAIDLVRERSPRIRSCEHEQCVLWFVDTSKGGRRRWCTMERCGNRAKAQRHYDRSKQG